MKELNKEEHVLRTINSENEVDSLSAMHEEQLRESGSGSCLGSGSGSWDNNAGGVIAGSYTILNHLPTLSSLILRWTDGTITRDCTSKLSIAFDNSYYTDIKDITYSYEARWIGLYGVTYSYSLSFQYKDNNKWLQYQHSDIGVYTIPESYRVNGLI